MIASSSVLPVWGVVVTFLAILLIHGVCIAFNVLTALFYKQLGDTSLEFMLGNVGIKMNRDAYPTFVGVYLFIACMHVVATLDIIARPCIRRLLGRLCRRRNPGNGLNAAQKTVNSVKMLVTRVFGRRGLLGVEGEYFDELLTTRELFETALQTYQAYRMSVYLPRRRLNQFYVSILILNCCVDVVLQRVFAQRKTLRRMLRLLVTSTLEVLTIVGVPSILVASYYSQYDPVYRDFSPEFWASDASTVAAANEFQLILTVSWMDLFSRIWLSIGILGSIDSIADCLFSRSTGVRIGPVWTTSTANIIAVPVHAEKNNAQPQQLNVAGALAFRWIHRLEKPLHILFALWGLLILGLHLQASLPATVPDCPFQVRPWFVSRPACAFLALDCHTAQIAGHQEEITNLTWVSVESDFVQLVIIRHCPELVVPAELSAFGHLNGMKIYNSTIQVWDESARLIGTNHPVIMFLSLARVDFPNGLLPIGLTSPDFPKSLLQIGICMSNLRDLPDDLDASWPMLEVLGLEYCNFTTIPPVVYRLQTPQLSFAGNHLTKFPVEMLATPGFMYLNIAENSIPAFPATSEIEDVGSLLFIFFSNTEISNLPAWIDEMIARSDFEFRQLYAAETPLCLRIQGTEGDGPVVQLPGTTNGSLEEDHSVLMENGARAAKEVFCDETPITFYMLEMDDAVYGLGT